MRRHRIEQHPIDKDFQDRWFFVRPDGIAVPDCGYNTQSPAGGLLSVVEKTMCQSSRLVNMGLNVAFLYKHESAAPQ